MRILSPEEVASLHIYRAWVTSCRQPRTPHPLPGGLHSYSSLYARHQLGRFTGQPCLGEWSLEIGPEYHKFCELVRGIEIVPLFSPGPPADALDPAWVPIYLSLYLLPEPTKSDLFRDVFLPYELACDCLLTPLLYPYPPVPDPLKRFSLI